MSDATKRAEAMWAAATKAAAILAAAPRRQWACLSISLGVVEADELAELAALAGARIRATVYEPNATFAAPYVIEGISVMVGHITIYAQSDARPAKADEVQAVAEVAT